MAPVKYKCDSNNSRGNFDRSKILLTEKLTNGALVTLTPVPVFLLGHDKDNNDDNNDNNDDDNNNTNNNNNDKDNNNDTDNNNKNKIIIIIIVII